METLSNCPVCNSKKFSDYITSVDYFLSQESFTICQCQGCNFLFTNPRPEEKLAQNYYKSEEYISHSNTDKGIISRIYKIVRNYSLNKKAGYILNYLSEGKVLDIGCGTGHFLSTMSKKGFQVTGIEPGKSAREFALKEFQFEIFKSVSELNPQKTKFNVITLWHVLEHIYDLKNNLITIKNLLADKGILILALPNPESYDANYYDKYWAAYDLPRHIYHFTKNDISNIADKLDFEIMDILPMKFDSFYVSLLSEKYKHTKTNYFSAFFTGLKSNIKARNNLNYSSLIYILKSKIT